MRALHKILTFAFVSLPLAKQSKGLLPNIEAHQRPQWATPVPKNQQPRKTTSAIDRPVSGRTLPSFTERHKADAHLLQTPATSHLAASTCTAGKSGQSRREDGPSFRNGMTRTTRSPVAKVLGAGSFAIVSFRRRSSRQSGDLGLPRAEGEARRRGV